MFMSLVLEEEQSNLLHPRLASPQAGSSCLHFGVRSYLHHFYEECSSSGGDRDAEDQGFVQSQRSAIQTSAVWKVEDLCRSGRVRFLCCAVP